MAGSHTGSKSEHSLVLEPALVVGLAVCMPSRSVHCVKLALKFMQADMLLTVDIVI